MMSVVPNFAFIIHRFPLMLPFLSAAMPCVWIDRNWTWNGATVYHRTAARLLRIWVNIHCAIVVNWVNSSCGEAVDWVNIHCAVVVNWVNSSCGEAVDWVNNYSAIVVNWVNYNCRRIVNVYNGWKTEGNFRQKWHEGCR